MAPFLATFLTAFLGAAFLAAVFLTLLAGAAFLATFLATLGAALLVVLLAATLAIGKVRYGSQSIGKDSP